MKGLLAPGQYDEALGILVKVGEVLKKELAGMGLTLIDFKIEVGYDENGKMYVVDEITPTSGASGTSRATSPTRSTALSSFWRRSKETAFPVAGAHSRKHRQACVLQPGGVFAEKRENAPIASLPKP